ncbi:MAG TPA: hypothetical protein VN112_16330 [Ensifer sp.]|nr:hypothetical protein [Ensifer sp.]
MSDDDELSEEQLRKMEANLLADTRKNWPKVEVRRGSGKHRPAPVELRFTEVVDENDDTWLFCEVHQKASSGWVKFESYTDQAEAKAAARKYAKNGDRVEHAFRVGSRREM